MVPPDHSERIARARLALEGTWLGDSFGQRFFFPHAFPSSPSRRALPSSPWHFTDDTVMTIGVVDVLNRFGFIHQDALAEQFAHRFLLDPARGYGAGAQAILSEIGQGTEWTKAASAAFGGTGSMGNGGAMRAAPIGAYFADDLTQVIEQADLSAQVTHSHIEGRCGAIAVAVAAALAHRRDFSTSEPFTKLLNVVSESLPESEVRRGVIAAMRLGRSSTTATAASELGCGHKVLAQDTVPFCLWVAARYRDDLKEALWQAASIGGDRDTTAAIVGGILSLWGGRSSLPSDWTTHCEPLPGDALGS